MLRILFVLAILVPGVGLALWSRYWGFLLYLWNACFRPQDFMWMPTSNFRLSLVLGLLFVLPAVFTGVFPNVTHPLTLGTLLFLITGIVAQVNAVDQDQGWKWIDAHSRLTIVLLLGANLIKTPSQLLGVLAVAAGSFGFYATKAGLVSFLGGGLQFREGLEGTFMDNNGYALATVMVIPMLVVLAQNLNLMFAGRGPRWLLRAVRLGLWVSVPLSMYTVVSTFSRGGFIALAAVGFAYAMFHPHRKRLLLAFALLACVIYVIPLPEGYLDRLSTIRQLEEDVDTPQEDVTEGRLYMWSLAIEMVQQQPLGIGMRNFTSRFNEFDEMRGAYGRRRDVHSSHFQVLVEHGFLGAAIWIFQFAYAFYLGRVIKKRSQTPGLSPEIKTFLETVPTGLMVSMSGFLVGGATISAALNELTWLTFILLAVLDRMSKKLCAEALKGVGPIAKPAPVFTTRLPAVARVPLPGRVSVAMRLQERHR